jgi:hypothetical protein
MILFRSPTTPPEKNFLPRFYALCVKSKQSAKTGRERLNRATLQCLQRKRAIKTF